MKLTRRQLRRIIQESVDEGKLGDKIKKGLGRAKKLANDTKALAAAHKDKGSLEPVKTVKEKMQSLVDEAPAKRALGQHSIKDAGGDVGQARTYAVDDAVKKLGGGRPIAVEISSDEILFAVVEK